MTMRVHHTNIRVVDPAPMVSFYRALGFRLYGCMHLGALYTLYLSLPNDTHSLEFTVNESGDPNWPRDMGVGHIAISVEDLDATLTALAAKGINPLAAPSRPANRTDVRVCFLQDPAGYKIELIDGGEFRPAREDLPASLGNYD
jgi:lactoylglutathione lyase